MTSGPSRLSSASEDDVVAARVEEKHGRPLVVDLDRYDRRLESGRTPIPGAEFR
jgi:hypothetical protein